MQETCVKSLIHESMGLNMLQDNSGFHDSCLSGLTKESTNSPSPRDPHQDDPVPPDPASKCDSCNKSFFTTTNVEKHVTSKHTPSTQSCLQNSRKKNKEEHKPHPTTSSTLSSAHFYPILYFLLASLIPVINAPPTPGTDVTVPFWTSEFLTLF